MFASTPAPLASSQCADTAHGWVNRRGYGHNVFETSNGQQVVRPTDRLEPLANAGPRTYLNKAALTSKVNRRLDRDMHRNCGLCPDAPACPTPSKTTVTCCDTQRQPVTCGHGGSTWKRGGCPRPGSGKC